MNCVLFDTSAYSKLLGGNKKIQKILDEANIVHISVIVLGELLAGFKKGNQEKANQGLLVSFLKQPTVTVLTITDKTASIWAQIMNALGKSGYPIPTNDVWIAAQSMEVGATLATLDSHFSFIKGLKLWRK